ncbi:MAG: M48 family metallopeptidase [Opitutaceae bacterium]|nr:M48 family metallopeptidase [Opitutaceae bacterium]
MDFFEAQALARKRSSRLVLLFGLAVLGTILAGYAAAMALFGQFDIRGEELHYDFDGPFRLWNPVILAWVAGGTVVVVGLASLFKWTQLRSGGAAVAEMVGGRRVAPDTTDLAERRLLNVVEEMAIASGVPVPAVFILDQEPGINAFAAGLTTSDAVVAVTKGALEKLTRDELQGVVAHEFSHILNGDMGLNVKLSAIVFGILFLGLIGRGLLYSLARGRVRGGKDKGGGIAVLVVIGLALLIVGYVGYFFGRLIQAAVSRQREFLADAAAVQFTRNPDGIAGVLKKIGGYTIGSRMIGSRAGEIGHFYFAQGFRSQFGGAWATHPPLPVRIRAIEPQWDGRFFQPKEVVDVKTQSFAETGLGGAPKPPPRSPTPGVPLPPPLGRIPFAAAAVVAEVGALTAGHFAQAQSVLESIPPSLRAAAHDARLAPALVYSLVLGSAEARDLVARHDSAAAAEHAARLRPEVAALPPAARLPLLQLAFPVLSTLDAGARERFVTTLDELVHSDTKVSTFEFALQKMLLHQLRLAGAPQARVDFHAFQAVADDIAIVLSTLARVGHPDETGAAGAFQAGASQLPLIRQQLALQTAGPDNLAPLDRALDRLAVSSLPIKKRVLNAAAHTIGSDGTVTAEEGELLRAIAVTIDCPLPLPAATA